MTIIPGHFLTGNPLPEVTVLMASIGGRPLINAIDSRHSLFLSSRTGCVLHIGCGE